jgi:hypothetical protein
MGYNNGVGFLVLIVRDARNGLGQSYLVIMSLYVSAVITTKQ